MLSSSAGLNCPSSFTACTPCPTDDPNNEVCACDDTTSVLCCIGGACQSSYIDSETSEELDFTECSCRDAGGCVVADCDDCVFPDDPCDTTSIDPLPTAGVICLPDNECIDIDKLGEKCEWESLGGVFKEGVSCEDDPCNDVDNSIACTIPSGCCCLGKTVTIYKVWTPTGCGIGNIPLCSYQYNTSYSYSWAKSLSACTQKHSFSSSYYNSYSNSCGTGWVYQLIYTVNFNVDCSFDICTLTNYGTGCAHAVPGCNGLNVSNCLTITSPPGSCP